MLYNVNIELGSKGISSDIVMDDGSRCLLDVINDPQLLQSFLESSGNTSGNVNGSVSLNQNVNLTVTATTNNTITSDQTDINGKSHKIQFSRVTNESNISSNNSYVISADGKQVDHVTSSVEYSSPFSELVIDEKQQQQQVNTAPINTCASNVLMTSVAVNQAVAVPSSAQSSISVSLPTTIVSGALTHSLQGASITMPASTPSPATTPIPIPIRSPVGGVPTTITWPQQIAAPRPAGGAISVIPQQLLQMPAGALQQVVQTVGGMPQVLIQQRPGVQIPGATTAVPAGQLVQIIQTPTGPAAQIVAAPPQASVQTVTTSNAKSSNSTTSSRSNKQILPKPPGSSGGGNSQSSSNGKQSQQQATQQPSRTVITNLQTSASVGPSLTTTSLQGAATANTPQILIGPGGQQFLVGQSGPQGTFLLNQMVPGLNHQPFLIQGNLGNIQGPIQLTLRPQAPQMVAVSNASGATSVSVASSSTQPPLLSALASTPTIQRTTNQPQTYVIPQATSASAPTAQSPAMMMTAGHPSLVARGQNLILTRPPGIIGSTSVPGTNGAPPTVPHLLQIQTPNGPMLVALQAAPSFPNASGASSMAQNNQPPTQTIMPLPTASLQQQNASSAHQTLQTILTSGPTDSLGQQHLQQNVSLCNVSTTNTVIYTQQTPANFTSPSSVQQQAVTLSASNTKISQNRTQAKSVNLAELLKETGILPESSPPTSPTSANQTTTEMDTTATALTQDMSAAIQTQQQPTVVMVPGGHNQPNILLTPAPGLSASGAPQLRLALAPDGSVILQPNITPVTQSSVLQTAPQQFQSLTKVQQQDGQFGSAKFTDTLKDTCGPGSSQPSPDSTTPTLDITTSSAVSAVTLTPVTTTTTTTSTTTTTASVPSKSALLQQLNSGPAVKVPDSVATLALQQGLTSVVKDEQKSSSVIPLTVQNINSTNEQAKEPQKAEVQKQQIVVTQPVQHVQSPANVIAPTTSSSAVIRIRNCDTFSTNATSVNTEKAKLESLVTTTVPTTTTTTTSLVEQNGFMQISFNNQEFIERLESQIKSLSSLKAPSVQQKTLLQEMLSLQRTMLEGKNQSQNHNLEGNIILTSQPQQVLKQQQSQQLQNVTPQQQQQHQQQQQQQQPQPQNVHLVNLLNKTPVNQPQLRFLTPSNVSTPSNGSTTFQVGNQLITITTPAKTQLQTIQTIATNQTPLQTQTILKPPLGTPATQLIQVVRLQPPSQTTPPSNQSIKSYTKTSDTKSGHEKQKIKVCQYFQQQLSADQTAALKPDLKNPFKDRKDACKRLLRYHVFNSRTPSDKLLADIDRDFELISRSLLRKKEELFNRYRLSLLKLCSKDSPTQEHVMLNKLFINEETTSLNHDKELILQGKELNLPPPPESWRQQLRESLQQEEASLEINRKRKSCAIEDEFIEECQQIKKLDPDDQEPVESEDEEEDSEEEEEEDEEVDENTNEDMTKYLGPNVSDLGNFLNNVGFNQPSMDMNSSVSCNHYSNSDRTQNNDSLYSNSEWRTSGFMSGERRLETWTHRFRMNENEDDVAVNTILDDEDEGDNELEVDLSAIPSLDDNEDDDEEGEDEDDDEEEEEEQDPSTIQMRCAINSILGNQQPFYNAMPPHTASTTYAPQVLHSMYHSSRNLDYNSGSQMMLQNDPVLDEAVKSILN